MTMTTYCGVRVSPTEADLLRRYERGDCMMRRDRELVVSIQRAVERFNSYDPPRRLS